MIENDEKKYIIFEHLPLQTQRIQAGPVVKNGKVGPSRTSNENVYCLGGISFASEPLVLVL
jgi:hypothetical protein